MIPCQYDYSDVLGRVLSFIQGLGTLPNDVEDDVQLTSFRNLKLIAEPHHKITHELDGKVDTIQSFYLSSEDKTKS